MVEYELIWASDEDGGIARDGIIPWNCPQDLRNFKRITTSGEGNIVIMGRKTWDSLPQMFKPLNSDRLNIVVTRNPSKIEDYEKYKDDERVYFVESFLEALQLSLFYKQNNAINISVFVIGGAQIYEEAIKSKFCVGIHETILDGYYNCDLHAPSFNSEDFEEIRTIELTPRAHYIYHRKKGTFQWVDSKALKR